MKYLIVSFDLELNRVIDQVTKAEKDSIKVGPLTWHGIAEETNESNQSYYDASTTSYPSEGRLVHHYSYHIAINDDTLVNAFIENIKILDGSMSYAECEKAHRACCRLLSMVVLSGLEMFLTKICDGVLANGGQLVTDKLTKDPDAKNQVLITDTDTIYIKLTGSLEGEPEKVFETEMPYGVFLVNTYMTFDLFEICRRKLELHEPKKPTVPEDIDTSDMSFDEESQDKMVEEIEKEIAEELANEEE